MKHFLLMLIFMVTNISSMFGQTETDHFVYDKDRDYFRVFLKEKEQVGTYLSKINIRMEYHNLVWVVNARVKPFQELIDEGTFSKERMKELEKANDSFGIYVFFNETGIVSDVYFTMPVARRSLLTDEELYCIYQKCLGVLYDLTNVVVLDANSLTPKVMKSFLAYDFFKIPFEALKY